MSFQTKPMEPLVINADEYEKLPTLKQFLKETGKKKLPEVFHVTKIWTPGKWQNYTFETEKFKVSITNRNPAFASVGELVDHVRNEGLGIKIRITDRDAGLYQLETGSDNWDIRPLGTSGFELVPISRG